MSQETGNQLSFRIRAIEWDSVLEIENLRLELGDGANLIQIRNGYGKTSTLKLLQSVFTGQTPEVEHWPRYKRDFGGDRERSRFSVEMEIRRKESEWVPYTVSLFFDHVNEELSWETTSPEIRGTEIGWRLPPDFAAKFEEAPAFAELFLFDGVKAKELCARQGHDQIESALRQLTGLSSVYSHTQEGGRIHSLRAEEFENLKDVSNAHKKRLNALHELRDHIKNVERTLAEAEEKKTRFDGELAGLNARVKVLQAQQEQGEQIEEMEDGVDSATKDLRTATGNLLDALADPANLPGQTWTQAREFYSKMLEMRIPEGVGRSFFDEILNQEGCICGEPWTDKMRDAVQERVDDYLGDEILTVVKTMQTQVRDASSPRVVVSTSVGKINGLRERIAEDRAEIERLQSKFEAGAYEQLKKLDKKRHRIQSELKTLDDLIEEIRCSDPGVIKAEGWAHGAIKESGEALTQSARFTKCRNLHSLRTVERTLNTKLAASEELLRLDNAVNEVTDVYAEALERVMSELRSQVEQTANRYLDDMPATGGGIGVEFRDDKIVFVDEFGHEQQTANMGAILAGAYAFIASMADLGSVDAPLVIDSPVTGMDYASAESWCTSIWPSYDQIIAFLQPAERGILEKREGSRALIYEGDVERKTLLRSDEGPDGTPQTGRMRIDESDELFRNYQADEAT